MLTHYVSFVAQRALPEATRQELWALWRAASIKLPNWWIGAKEVALMTPSSCTVDNRRRVLEDYMCGSVLVRYNRIWMKKDNL